jgi:hypothetical protein
MSTVQLEAEPPLSMLDEPGPSLGPDVKFDDEFQRLVPPHSAAELAALEASLIEQGCLDPLVTWDGVLVEGYAELDLCRKHRIPYRVKSITCADRAAATLWVVRRYLGRPTLSVFAKAELVAPFEPVIAAEAREKLKTSTGGAKPRPVRKAKEQEPNDTATAMGAFIGVKRGTWLKARLLIEEADDETKARLRAGKLKINGAYNLLPSRQRLKKKKMPLQPRTASTFDQKKIAMPSGRVGHLKTVVLVQWEDAPGWKDANLDELFKQGGKIVEPGESPRPFATPAAAA